MTVYYGLFLNPMTGRMEERNIVATASDPAILKRLLDECRCEPWTDTDSSGKVWNKSFKSGSELEWFNPPEHCGDGYGIVPLGTREQWCENAGNKFDAFVNRFIRH